MNISDLKIAGWQKVSLIDYPGKISSVIFLAGCNMCCHYCHNHHILNSQQNQIPFVDILKQLKQRRFLVDAVVVSGGEPTLYGNLYILLRALKDAGFMIKLDTNGTRVDVIRQVVESGLVDYVALDVKATPEKYQLVTGVTIDVILESVAYLKKQNLVPYQFRTTLSPYLNQQDLIQMGKTIISGAKIWQIQQCRCLNAYSREKVLKMTTKLRKYASYVVVKGV